MKTLLKIILLAFIGCSLSYSQSDLPRKLNHTSANKFLTPKAINSLRSGDPNLQVIDSIIFESDFFDKFYFTYNTNGTISSTKSFSGHDTCTYEMFYTYDSNYNMIESSIHKTDAALNHYYYKTKLFYNTDNEITNYEGYERIDTLSPWTFIEKGDIIEYANPNIADTIIYRYDTITSSWVGYKRTYIEYENGNVSVDVYYLWDNIEKEWDLHSKNTYQYNTNNKLILKQFWLQHECAGPLEVDIYDQYVYDSNNRLIHFEYIDYDSTECIIFDNIYSGDTLKHIDYYYKNGILETLKYQYSFLNQNGKADSTVYYTFDETLAVFKPIEIRRYTYNLNDSLIYEEHRSLIGDIMLYSNEKVYDNLNRLSSETSYIHAMNYVIPTIGDTKTIYEYEGNSNTVIKIKSYKWDYLSWYLSDSTVIEYDFSTPISQIYLPGGKSFYFLFEDDQYKLLSYNTYSYGMTYLGNYYYSDYYGNCLPVIETSNPDNTIKIYPTNDNTALQIKGLSVDANLKVIDLNGNVLVNKTVNPDDCVSINSFNQGVYIALLISENKQTTQKFIKK